MGSPGDSSGPDLTPLAAMRLLHALDDGPDRNAHSGAPDGGGTAVAGVEAGGGLAAPPGYCIAERIGRGGGGTVYRAFREGSDLPVALKVLAMPLGSGPEAQRAWRELDLLESLRLPAVPRLLDYGTHDGRLFFVTEFVDGRRPDEHADAERLGVRERVAMLGRICDAVQSLHEHGVIHRDIKPANILITPAGAVVILDLGLASLLAEEAAATLTSDGQPVGTPAYMSPEQARGERSRLSTRTDVYALGALAYLLLTGHTPHDTRASLHEAVRRVAQDPPRPARTLEPTLPKPLAAVLDKACSQAQERRYASAGELAADLRRWLAGRPVEATPPGPWVRMVRRVQRHPIAATATACVLVAAGTWGGTWASVWRMNQQPYDVFVDSTRRTASIVTRLGKPLHTWEAAREGGIRLAMLIDAGPGFKPRLRVLTVIEDPVGLDPELDVQLCVWDAHRPDRLLWRTRADTEFIRAPRTNLPPTTSNDFLTTPERYGVSGEDVVVADIFSDPEYPGDEILAPHGHRQYDPAAIRVYSMDGEVLFEAWHWGAARTALSAPEAGQIVAYGCDNIRTWNEIGLTSTPVRWPRVVFAVRPTPGGRHGWVNPELAEPGDEPLWYRYLLPPEVTDYVGGVKWSARIQSGDLYSPGIVRVEVTPIRIAGWEPGTGFIPPEWGSAFYLELDASGQVVSTWQNDAWRDWASLANPPTPYIADSPLEVLRGR